MFGELDNEQAFKAWITQNRYHRINMPGGIEFDDMPQNTKALLRDFYSWMQDNHLDPNADRVNSYNPIDDEFTANREIILAEALFLAIVILFPIIAGSILLFLGVSTLALWLLLGTAAATVLYLALDVFLFYEGHTATKEINFYGPIYEKYVHQEHQHFAVNADFTRKINNLFAANAAYNYAISTPDLNNDGKGVLQSATGALKNVFGL